MEFVKRALRARREARQFDIVRSILQGRPLTLVDVGAAGGIEPRWKPYAPLLDYIGFEPDAAAFGRINNPVFHSYEIIPQALWSSNGPLNINISREEGKSSHYPPNMKLMRRFPRPERIEVVETAIVEAVRMDEVMQDRACDFIKLDVQGGELEILKGAAGVLPRCIGLELEVEFVPMYEGQPLFGDICAYLSSVGFEFVDFVHLCRWERDRFTDVGQCIFGDAFFLRPDPVDSPQYRAILAIYDRLDLLEHISQDPVLAARRRADARKRSIGRFVSRLLEAI